MNTDKKFYWLSMTKTTRAMILTDKSQQNTVAL